MRMSRTTTLPGMGLTAVFGLAQVGAAMFLIQRAESYHPFTSLERVLVVGVVLLLVCAQMLVAAGAARPD
ncbi:MAG: hypothetical protein ACPL7R_01300 [Anaerolineae bacterium]